MPKPQTAPTFESILDTPADDVERPKPLPVGIYDAIIQGLYEEGVSSQKKTPFVQFAFAITSAGEDVDEDELLEWATSKDGTVKQLGGTVLKNNSTKFYTTPDSLFRLTDFLEKVCGIELEGKKIRQALSETPNCSVRLEIGHVASQDGEQIFAEVKKFLPQE
jgi:hypothetical protein